MPQVPEHINWFIDTGERLKTADGKEVWVWEFQHQDDDVLSAWAKHFRSHYCFNSEIDYWLKGYKYSRSEYLTSMKLPEPSAAPSPKCPRIPSAKRSKPTSELR